MASFYEEFAVTTFEVLAKQITREDIEVVRTNMKPYISKRLHYLSKNDIDISNLATSEDISELIEAATNYSRTPDGVTVLNPRQSQKFGLAKKNMLIFIEAEYSAPMNRQVLWDYSNVWRSIDCSDLHDFWSCSVAVVDHYGRFQFLDLQLVENVLGRMEPKHSTD